MSFVDQPIFTRLISDLFMGIEVDRKIDAQLVETSKVVAREMGLQVPYYDFFELDFFSQLN